MCGRYQIDTNKEEIEKHYGLDFHQQFKSRYNTAPSQKMPVVLDDRIELMEWGLPLKFGDKFVRNLINIRDDSLSKGWAKRYIAQRCLVPATGYYEWKKTSDGKVPYYFGVKNHKLFSFAGLYDGEHFGIITTGPNKQAATIHNRMPAILTREEEKEWVNADNAELEQLSKYIHPYHSEITYFPISTAINNPRNDTPSAVVKI